MIPKGFRYAGARCGLKNKRNDVGIWMSDTPAVVAGLTTQNLVHASCVDVMRQKLSSGSLQAMVVNSGNANCMTGPQGLRDTERMGTLGAEALGLPEDLVGVASTGVIGRLMDMARVERGIAEAATKLGSDPRPFMDAILTTDLVEKQASISVGTGMVFGVCKGSGMIAPNMATMLAFIATDLEVDLEDLRAALVRANDKSFGSLTVDSDSSTNDMVVAMANGASGVKPSQEELQKALDEVCISLARQVARDGEGATKLVEVQVVGSDDPKRVARTIAESPLVKTAMFGCDPNWGRILAAAGRSGVSFDPLAARLWLEAAGEDHVLFEDGSPANFDPKHVSTALKSDVVRICLHLGEGASATVFTCDFGYGYVRINAEYHT